MLLKGKLDRRSYVNGCSGSFWKPGQVSRVYFLTHASVFLARRSELTFLARSPESIFLVRRSDSLFSTRPSELIFLIASLSFRISVLRPRSELIFLVRCAGAESSANEDTKTLRTLAHQDPVTYGLGWFRGHVALQGALMMDQDCLSFFIVKLAASGTSECSKRGGTLVQDFGQKYFPGFRCGRGPISRTPERQSALSGQKIFSKEFVEGDVLAFRGC